MKCNTSIDHDISTLIYSWWIFRLTSLNNRVYIYILMIIDVFRGIWVTASLRGDCTAPPYFEEIDQRLFAGISLPEPRYLRPTPSSTAAQQVIPKRYGVSRCLKRVLRNRLSPFAYLLTDYRWTSPLWGNFFLCRAHQSTTRSYPRWILSDPTSFFIATTFVEIL